MLSAKDAAARTAMARQEKVFEHELRTISQRIDGASAAGASEIEIVFEGNAFDEEAAQLVSQILIDSGYRVRFKQRTKLGNCTGCQFNISW